jgi:hypothetical protein
MIEAALMQQVFHHENLLTEGIGAGAAGNGEDRGTVRCGFFNMISPGMPMKAALLKSTILVVIIKGLSHGVVLENSLNNSH